MEAGGETLDRCHLPASNILQKGLTRAGRLAVDVNGAGTALCYTAAKLGAGELEMLTDDPKKGGIGFGGDIDGTPVDSECCHEGFSSIGCLFSR